jgi:fatty acid desaturase
VRRLVACAVLSVAVEEPGSKEHYAELVRRVRSEGLLQRDDRAYVQRIAFTFSLYALAVVAFFFVADSWWTVVVALLAGLTFSQVAFLAHDAGHRQAFATKVKNERLLLVCGNLLTGISGTWWFSKHHRHHVHPNNVELDPDVNVRFFAYTREQGVEKSGLWRFTARHQHLAYFPMATLQGWSLHFASVVALLRGVGVRNRPLETAALLTHFVVYFGVLAAVLSPTRLVVFVLVHQAVFGVYLASTFAPNHKGMAMFTDEPPFMRLQVLTARNVSGGRFVEFLTGGLNYQIEHHLFPSMPRPHLRRAQPIVESYCAEIGLSYHQEPLFTSLASVVRFFRSNSTAVQR